jgi:NADH-quinone oxidoreductase subunit J
MLLADAQSGFSLNWTVLAPVVLGFLAVCYMLPSPRKRSLTYGALGIVVAILGFAAFLLRGFAESLPFSAESFLFVAFSLEAFTFGILMIVQRNPARSALFFAVVVLSVCGLFLLLGAPFLMAATIIIYAGAIIVTFLFVIMLSQAKGYSDANDRSREPSLAATVGFVVLGTLLVVLQRVYSFNEVDELIRQSTQYAESPVVDPVLREPARAREFLDRVIRVRDRLGYEKLHSLMPTYLGGHDPVGQLRYTLDLEPTIPSGGDDPPSDPDPADVRKWSAQIRDELTYLRAVRDGRLSPAADDVVVSPHGQVRNVDTGTAKGAVEPSKLEPHRLPNANIAAIGRTLFTDHLLAVELGGTLLLVATIGAIAIAGGRPENTA